MQLHAQLPAIDRLSLAQKRVLIRVDFNVPLTSGQQISDDTRIRAALPTIQHAIRQGAKVILASHLGRPKGKVKPKLSLKPAAERLQELLGSAVTRAADCVGTGVQQHVRQLAAGAVLILENLRFHAEEEANDPTFSQDLSALADVYINDAFGSSHRSHASVVGVVQYFEEQAVGFLMRKEIHALSSLLSSPEHPFVAILGGAKVSDKIGLIRSLLARADHIIIGGAMAYTLLQAQGIQIGRSLVEQEKVEEAKAMLALAANRGVAIHLPQDHVIVTGLKTNVPSSITSGVDVPRDSLGVDIGPQTARAFRTVIQSARTVLWNGPMGIFEQPPFDQGTRSVAEAVAAVPACYSVAGGGDTVAALTQTHLADQISHISTGGGATLQFLESGDLPGLAALRAA